jgi:hypothetical protein
MLEESKVIEWINGYYYDEEILMADGLDDAIIGIEETTMRLIYSKKKVIDILINKDGMTEEEAEEFFWFNIHGAWVGERTPIWCIDISKQNKLNQNKDDNN